MSKVAIVGAGVVGLSVAWFLAEAGLDVTVWESRHPGGGASGQAHGQLVPPAPVLRPLWRHSLDVYRRLADVADFDWDRDPVGTLVLATAEEDLPHLRQRNAAGDGLLLDPAALRQREPALGPDVVAGLLFEEGRRIHPPSVVAALASAARRAGAAIHTGSPIVRIQPRNGQWRLLTANGLEIDQTMVVLAGGLDTMPLAARLGHSIPLLGIRGRILLTDPQPPLLRHLIADCVLGTAAAVAASHPTARTVAAGEPVEPFIALLAHQRPDGRLLLGASWLPHGVPEPSDLDKRLAVTAMRTIPAVADARVVHRWSGTRPCTPDGRPIIDRIAPGLYVCAGHGGEGFISGPGSGWLLAQLLLGTAPYTDVAPFRLNRWKDETG